MDIERETVVEIVVSVGAVGLFVAALVGIGGAYNEGGFAADGGIALVGAITAFVILMTLVGVGLAYYMNQES